MDMAEVERRAAATPIDEYWAGIRFSDDEYRRRLDALRAEMARANIDAAMIADERNTWYFTGFGDYAPMGSRARPRVLLVPAEGKPIFFVHQSTKNTVAEMVSDCDVQTYATIGRAPVEELGRRLLEWQARRVGAELGSQLRPELGLEELLDLKTVISPAALCDVSPAVWRVRMIKSAAEIARIRSACSITTRAYDTLFASIRPGITERAVMRRACEALVSLGADNYWAVAVSGHGEYARVDGVPRHRTIERNELVFVDCGANVAGYWADFSRAAIVGEPSPEQEWLQRRIQEATAAGVDAIGPGVRISDVARRTADVMNEYGLEFSTRSGRMGHGLGMLITEPPDICETSDLVLEVGMVVTIEPGVIRDCGIFHCEENIVVTADGYERLSTAPSDLTHVDVQAPKASETVDSRV
jgi:Xaa-Pro aminopeptidase